MEVLGRDVLNRENKITDLGLCGSCITKRNNIYIKSEP